MTPETLILNSTYRRYFISGDMSTSPYRMFCMIHHTRYSILKKNQSTVVRFELSFCTFYTQRPKFVVIYFNMNGNSSSMSFVLIRWKSEDWLPEMVQTPSLVLDSGGSGLLCCCAEYDWWLAKGPVQKDKRRGTFLIIMINEMKKR